MMAEESQTGDVLTEEQQLALTAIKEKFGGKWKETHHENVEAFYSEMGINFILRKLVSMVKIEMEFVVEDGTIKIFIKLPGKTEISNLNLHKETDNTNRQGKFKVTASYENEQLVSRATPHSGTPGKPLVVRREITSTGELLTTFEVGDVVCKRYFSKFS